MQPPALNSLLPHRWKIISALLFFGLNSTVAFAQANAYEKQMGGIESIQKTLCLNGLWNTACSSESADILKCAHEYTGEQAQRICQYELGLARRRWEWFVKEEAKRTALAAEQERLRKIAAADAETKRKIVEAQAREDRAQDCIKAEFPVVRDALKKVREFAKKKVGADMATRFDELDPDFNYSTFGYVPVILSIQEQVRPILSNPALEFRMETSCDSTTKYFGYVVSLDGQKIDGFLAFRNSPNRPDGVDWVSEINELEWLGPRIKAEEKRLKAVKAESDRQNLEKSKAEADKKAAEEAKVKAQQESDRLFVTRLFWGLLLGGAFSGYFYYRYRRTSEETRDVADAKPSAPVNYKYNFVPSTNVQVDMPPMATQSAPLMASQTAPPRPP